MVNRYITALLVVLATTGMETATYQSVLRLAMADMSYEQVCLQPEARDLEANILAVIKAIKEANEEHQNDKVSAPKILRSRTMAANLSAYASMPALPEKGFSKMQFFGNGIVIRGPDTL